MATNIIASVIIPTYNREDDLVRAIHSVLQQTFVNFELIIVDQTKDHNAKTARYLSAIHDERFKYYKVSPPSLPAARNFAIAKASASIIIFIDDDVELDAGFIKEHVKTYKNPQVGGVAGRVCGPTEPISDTLYRLSNSGKRVGAFNYDKNGEAMAARGCNMSFRKEILEDIGGFDTMYVGNAYREDTDISFRVRKAGYKILFRTKASLTHYDAPTGGCRENAGLFDSINAFKNNFRFFYKNEPRIFLFSFYITHLTKIVPSLNPILLIKRFYYLLLGSCQAKQELRNNTQIIAKE